MARSKERLSDRELRHLKPRPTAYGDGGGLWFRVRKLGQTDGFFRYAITEAERAADSEIGNTSMLW